MFLPVKIGHANGAYISGMTHAALPLRVGPSTSCHADSGSDAAGPRGQVRYRDHGSVHQPGSIASWGGDEALYAGRTVELSALGDLRQELADLRRK
jgi:hypothetical protein